MLGCLACDGEAVLALMKGSFACGLVLCLSYVARLCGLRWGGGASVGARLLCMWAGAMSFLCARLFGLRWDGGASFDGR